MFCLERKQHVQKMPFLNYQICSHLVKVSCILILAAKFDVKVVW